MSPSVEDAAVTIPWAWADAPEPHIIESLYETRHRLERGVSAQYGRRSRLRVHPDDVAAMLRLEHLKQLAAMNWGAAGLDDNGDVPLAVARTMFDGYGLPQIEPDPAVPVGSAVWIGTRPGDSR